MRGEPPPSRPTLSARPRVERPSQPRLHGPITLECLRSFRNWLLLLLHTTTGVRPRPRPSRPSQQQRKQSKHQWWKRARLRLCPFFLTPSGPSNPTCLRRLRLRLLLFLLLPPPPPPPLKRRIKSNPWSTRSRYTKSNRRKQQQQHQTRLYGHASRRPDGNWKQNTRRRRKTREYSSRTC